MPTAIIMDFAAESAIEKYDAVMQDMNLGGVLPPGALRHVAGPTDEGLRVVDVWEDGEAFGRFAAEKIGPISAKNGVPEPVTQTWEVVFEAGADADPGFLHVVTMPGVDAAAFRMLADQVMPDGALPAGLIWHVNGPVEGGYRTIGAWISRAARDEFLETKIRPVMEAAGVTTQPTIEDLEVHNSMSKVASTA